MNSTNKYDARPSHTFARGSRVWTAYAVTQFSICLLALLIYLGDGLATLANILFWVCGPLITRTGHMLSIPETGAHTHIHTTHTHTTHTTHTHTSHTHTKRHIKEHTYRHARMHTYIRSFTGTNAPMHT